jgi:hypothetical protein
MTKMLQQVGFILVQKTEKDEEVLSYLLPVAKKRKASGRLHKSGSHWWKRYLCAEMKAEMTAEPEGRVAKRFRRNFRMTHNCQPCQFKGGGQHGVPTRLMHAEDRCRISN